jgi:hypothetical protein
MQYDLRRKEKKRKSWKGSTILLLEIFSHVSILKMKRKGFFIFKGKTSIYIWSQNFENVTPK